MLCVWFGKLKLDKGYLMTSVVPLLYFYTAARFITAHQVSHESLRETASLSAITAPTVAKVS